MAHELKKKRKLNVVCNPPYALVISLGQKWQRTLVSKIKFLQPMRWANVHPRSPIFVILGKGAKVLDFLDSSCSWCVPIKFSLCSHEVFQFVPNMFLKFPMCSPTCFQYHLTLSHTLCIIFYSCNLCKQTKKEETAIYLFWDCAKSLFGHCISNSRSPSQRTNIGNTVNQKGCN